MANKSEKRIEAKKRKAQAFLQMIKSEQIEQISGHQKVESTSDPPPEKKTKSGEGEKNSVHGESSSATLVTEKPRMSDEMFAEYKRVMREKQKQAMQRPKIFLTLDEMTRDFPCETVTDTVKEVPPLFITDIQNLLLYSLQGNIASCKPRWCQLLRVMKVSKVIAVVLDSLSKEDYDTHQDYLPTLKSAFDINVKLVPPVQYGSSVREELLHVPFSLRLLQSKMPGMGFKKFNKIRQNINELKNFKEKLSQSETDKTDEENSMVVEGSEDMATSDLAGSTSNTTGDHKFDRRLLMLSPEQMIKEGIPMPYDVQNEKFKEYKFSKSQPYKEVHSRSPIFAVDCEMVQTTESRMDLARVSIVNEKLETVYDTYVKPRAKVLDYVTRYSGITKEILDPVKTTLEDVQKQIDSLLPPDAILCGQSIGADLRSLKMFHPYVIDTSVIYNLTGDSNRKTGLKMLTSHFLDKTIQDDDKKGHSSVEDAMATMELVLLKLQNDLTFGNYSLCSMGPFSDQEGSEPEGDVDLQLPQTLQFEAVQKQHLFFQQIGRKYTESFVARIGRQNKTGVVIDEMGSEKLYGDEYLVLRCATDKQRELQTTQSCQDVDFCLSHLYGYRDFLADAQAGKQHTEEEKEKSLWKLDRRLWKILRSVPPRSVFVAILTGRQEDSTIYPAMAFAKVV